MIKINIHSGDQRTVELLIKKGANLNGKNIENSTELIWTAIKGNFQTEKSKIDQNECIKTTTKTIVCLFRLQRNSRFAI